MKSLIFLFCLAGLAFSSNVGGGDNVDDRDCVISPLFIFPEFLDSRAFEDQGDIKKIGQALKECAMWKILKTAVVKAQSDGPHKKFFEEYKKAVDDIYDRLHSARSRIDASEQIEYINQYKLKNANLHGFLVSQKFLQHPGLSEAEFLLGFNQVIQPTGFVVELDSPVHQLVVEMRRAMVLYHVSEAAKLPLRNLNVFFIDQLKKMTGHYETVVDISKLKALMKDIPTPWTIGAICALVLGITLPLVFGLIIGGCLFVFFRRRRNIMSARPASF
jgi:hypothetical protein